LLLILEHAIAGLIDANHPAAPVLIGAPTRCACSPRSCWGEVGDGHASLLKAVRRARLKWRSMRDEWAREGHRHASRVRARSEAFPCATPPGVGSPTEGSEWQPQRNCRPGHVPPGGARWDSRSKATTSRPAPAM
jgi:hypothetical protein